MRNGREGMGMREGIDMDRAQLLEGQFILVLPLTMDSLTTDPKYANILITCVAKQRIWAGRS
jgi:hypothetical protein